MTPPTVIIRHRKENLKKCSLHRLEQRKDLLFITYPFLSLPSIDRYLVLTMEEGPELSISDRNKGILLLDSTWRYLPKMMRAVDRVISLEKRVLPGHFRTAYPRRQEDCIDSIRGLSSLEALFISYRIVGRSVDGLLDHYYWKNQFLELNDF
jgi:pre-rRNA-processing protein TSR3